MRARKEAEQRVWKAVNEVRVWGKYNKIETVNPIKTKIVLCNDLIHKCVY